MAGDLQLAESRTQPDYARCGTLCAMKRDGASRCGDGHQAPQFRSHFPSHHCSINEERTMDSKHATVRSAVDTPFLSDVKALRQRARQHIESGAVTANYGVDSTRLCDILNQALATEILCVLRYKRHYFMAVGLAAEAVKTEFLAHANEEQAHADEIASRIVQLGGDPDLNPDGLSRRSHSEYVEGTTLRDMIKEDLVAERVAIESYREIIAWLDGKDPTTRKMLEGILAIEEEHAEDMSSLLAGLKD
jgi:bacterioferritin